MSSIGNHLSGAACAAVLLGSAVGASAQTLPSDPKPSCVVPAPTFASWFQSGTPSLNGVVNPANSVTFSAQPNCSFYQWSKQMFLWLTSPSPPVYGSGAFIFDSPAFFDVSPLDSTGHRTLLPHTPGFIHALGVRVSQLGPGGIPVIFDRAGQMFELAPTRATTAAPQVVDATGARRVLAHAAFNEQGAVTLTDAAGAVIERRAVVAAPRPVAKPTGPLVQVQRLIIDNIPIFIDPLGNVVEVEQGEAGNNDVLMAQNKSLVYYATFVNDVYAYFLTGWRDNQIQAGNPNPVFPTSLSDLNAITTFAAAHGVTFPDPDALAIEVKTSWVEASSLPDPGNYITMTATIPAYNESNSTAWPPTGQKTVLLAMVGMHVVGSTSQHPEMVWATFEHVGNTPFAAYSYLNSVGAVTNVAASPAGNWLFAHSVAGPFNVPHMNAVSPAVGIKALTSQTISPSDTIRWKPFGAASNLAPNPLASPAASNSDIIAINNSVAAQMPVGDLRGNYIFSGATWTIPGVPPGPSGSGAQVGTSELANSTMETYDQGSATTAGGANCIDCHSSFNQNGQINQSTFVAGVSHIFFAIKQLF